MDAKTEPPVQVSRDDSVLTLTLNRPEQRNALSEATMRALQIALDEAAEDAGVRVIILAAKGPAFCAGHDLKELASHRGDEDRGLAYFRSLFAQCSQVMQTIVRHPRPIIAQVQGMATAAGCQLVATCDLTIASTEAKFATPGVNIGLFCSTPMVALSRNIPRKHAMEMLLTGEPIGAARAVELGLVNHAVAPGDLESETAKYARYIASKPSRTIKTGKVAFYRQLEMGYSSAYEYVNEVMTQNMLDADAVEGIGAFLEKRPPKWPE